MRSPASPLALCLLLLLSGCAAKEAGGQASDPLEGSVADAGDGSPAPTLADPPKEESPRPAAAAAPASRPPSPEPVAASCEAHATAGVGDGGSPALAVMIRAGCKSGELEAAPGGAFRSAVVEMAWSNAAPTLVEAEFAVVDLHGDRLLGTAKGTGSPLRLVLTGGDFPEGPSAELGALIGGTGVYADFKATFTFQLYELAEPPAGSA